MADAALPAETARQEVSGTDDLLCHAIDQGDIAVPTLMNFNDWQKWRSGVGRRPTKNGLSAKPKVGIGVSATAATPKFGTGVSAAAAKAAAADCDLAMAPPELVRSLPSHGGIVRSSFVALEQQRLITYIRYGSPR